MLSNSFKAYGCLLYTSDSLTNIIFRPNVSYDKTRGASVAESGTFNEDPYQYVVNPNDYLNFDNIESDDPLRDCLLYTSRCV